METIAIIAGIVSLLERVGPVLGKLTRGEELTPEERAFAERVSAFETARADALDEQARLNLSEGGGA